MKKSLIILTVMSLGTFQIARTIPTKAAQITRGDARRLCEHFNNHDTCESVEICWCGVTNGCDSGKTCNQLCGGKFPAAGQNGNERIPTEKLIGKIY